MNNQLARVVFLQVPRVASGPRDQGEGVLWLAWGCVVRIRSIFNHLWFSDGGADRLRKQVLPKMVWFPTAAAAEDTNSGLKQLYLLVVPLCPQGYLFQDTLPNNKI